MHLGNIKITYNRTAQPRCYHNAFYGRPFREPRRQGNWLCYDDLALLNQQLQVCFVISLSICYWLLKCWVLCVVCMYVCMYIHTHHSFITVFHHSVCHVTVPLSAWTDGKTKDIINCLYIYFESWSSGLWKGALHFWLMFGQSQCTVPVSQSEQTVLVGKRGLV